MDKQLLKAYIKVVVEEEVKRLLPEMLAEAVQQIKSAQPTATKPITEAAKSKIDRSRLAALMGLEYDRDGGTLSASTNHMAVPPTAAPPDVDPSIVNAITKDYSALMKAMKLT
jgi:hypothetical protein